MACRQAMKSKINRFYAQFKILRQLSSIECFWYYLFQWHWKTAVSENYSLIGINAFSKKIAEGGEHLVFYFSFLKLKFKGGESKRIFDSLRKILVTVWQENWTDCIEGWVSLMNRDSSFCRLNCQIIKFSFLWLREHINIFISSRIRVFISKPGKTRAK